MIDYQYQHTGNLSTRVIQCNTQKSSAKHAALLQVASQAGVDAICVQEPWISPDLKNRRTQTHPAYIIIPPTSVWKERPRVMTYVRAGLQYHRQALDGGGEHPDIGKNKIVTHDGTNLTLINVYNASGASTRPNEGTECLFREHIPRHSIVCGDFNLHHSMWDVRARHDDARAGSLLEWAADEDLLLITDPHVPTRAAAVIDLVFTTVGLSERYTVGAAVDVDLSCGSDHLPTLITLKDNRYRASPARQAPQGPFKLEKMDEERFHELCKEKASQIRWDTACRKEDREAEITLLASKIQEVITYALTQSTPRSSGRGTGQPWWTEECQIARKAENNACAEWKRSLGTARENDARIARNQSSRNMAGVVARAKRAFYRERTSNLRDTRDLFRAVKMIRTKQKTASPVLKNAGDRLAESPADKIDLLMKSHLSRSAETDLPGGAHIPPEPTRRVWEPFTMDEVKRAVHKPANTMPGIDALPNAVLKCAWADIGHIITALYNMSFEWGVIPPAFKSTRLCVLPKDGKRDTHNPRSYRLIALLPTLSKGLERAIAIRLAHEAVEQEILSPRYMCATPQGAATDLLLSLVDQIEWELKMQKRIVTVLTFDVKGAFDAVGPNRMIERLISQKWPTRLCHWVRAFLSDRTADMILDGEVGGSRCLGGSLPQGSPISPILFMLFMAPLYQQRSRLRGYADDGCATIANDSFIVNILEARRELELVNQWCQENGLELDLGKTALMHFTTRRTNENPGIFLPNGEVRQAVSPNGALKWLGVFLDRKLTFRQHIKEVCRKAQNVVDGMKVIAGCYKGAPIDSLLQVVRGGVLPTLTYGFQAWWRTPGRRTATWMINALDTIMRNALRAALPMYRTTPNHLLMHASGTPPVEIILDDMMHGLAIRIAKLGPRHIIHARLPNCRIKRIMDSLPMPIRMARYFRYTGPTLLEQQFSINCEGRTNAAQEHLRWRSQDDGTSFWVYTDGSRDGHGRTGAGWLVEKRNITLAEGRKACGSWKEVYDAEAEAALEGIKCAKACASHDCIDKVYLCLDNRSVATRIAAGPNANMEYGSSQDTIDRIRQELAQWPSGRAHVCWVPGHLDIPGNERADFLAKNGCEVPRREETCMSLARARRWRGDELKRKFREWWASVNRGAREQQLEKPTPWGARTFKHLKRAHAGRVLAARSSHGDFAHYHRRFDHQDAILRCPSCEQEKTPLHPWTCRGNVRRLSERFVGKLIGTARGMRLLARRLEL